MTQFFLSFLAASMDTPEPGHNLLGVSCPKLVHTIAPVVSALSAVLRLLAGKRTVSRERTTNRPSLSIYPTTFRSRSICWASFGAAPAYRDNPGACPALPSGFRSSSSASTSVLGLGINTMPGMILGPPLMRPPVLWNQKWTLSDPAEE